MVGSGTPSAWHVKLPSIPARLSDDFGGLVILGTPEYKRISKF